MSCCSVRVVCVCADVCVDVRTCSCVGVCIDVGVCVGVLDGICVGVCNVVRDDVWLSVCDAYRDGVWLVSSCSPAAPGKEVAPSTLLKRQEKVLSNSI